VLFQAVQTISTKLFQTPDGTFSLHAYWLLSSNYHFNARAKDELAPVAGLVQLRPLWPSSSLPLAHADVAIEVSISTRCTATR